MSQSGEGGIVPAVTGLPMLAVFIVVMVPCLVA
jgi:hypothetical protein